MCIKALYNVIMYKWDTKCDAKYIWHTMGDDKVRSEHAARNGQIFDFDNPPEGGNPGDAPNCRCWAEPIEEKI